MAVPSSGSLNMSGLAKEKLYDDYNSSSTAIGPIFMSDLVTGGNSSGSAESYDATNTSSSSFPNNATPHAFSEWYGYNHDATVGPAFGYYEMFLREGFQLYTGVEPEYSGFDSPDPTVVDANPFGGPTRWRWFSIDLLNPSAPAQFPEGTLIRPQMLFADFNGPNLRNDVAISGDWLYLDANGQVVDFEPFTSSEGVEFNEFGPIVPLEDQDTYTEFYPRYVGFTIRPYKYPSNVGQKSIAVLGDPAQPTSSITWQDVNYGTETQNGGTWNYNLGTTPSNGTGPEDNVYLDPYRGFSFAVWVQGTIADPQDPFFDPNPQTVNGHFYYEASNGFLSPNYSWFRWKTPTYVPANARYLTFAYCAWSEDGPSTFAIDYLKGFIEVVDPSGLSITPPPTFS